MYSTVPALLLLVTGPLHASIVTFPTTTLWQRCINSTKIHQTEVFVDTEGQVKAQALHPP
jgi:hypothetical protein